MDHSPQVFQADNTLEEEEALAALSLSMRSPVKTLLEQRITEYDNMEPEEQKQKLEQILNVYARGDAVVVEGLKLTFHAIVDLHKNVADLEVLQSTLPLANKLKVEDQFRKINEDIAEVTKLIFPYDEKMACEMIKEEYKCEQQ